MITMQIFLYPTHKQSRHREPSVKQTLSSPLSDGIQRDTLLNKVILDKIFKCTALSTAIHG